MSGAEARIVLRAEKVTKTFPGTVALDGVDFFVHAAAVNVLIGENGAGKSTLMKILAGVDQPSTGRLLLDGKPVRFASIRDAARHGIGIVFQELNLCPNMTVAENIFLGRDITRGGIDIDRPAQRVRARQLFRRLEHDIDPETPVGDLMIGEQQIVEIAKALAEDARILIMDEPTSALSVAEVQVLFRVIDELKHAGVAVIYISHRLDELVHIGDYFTVLRDGRLQATATRQTISIPWIIRQMLGSEAVITRRPPAVAPGPVTLEVEASLSRARAASGWPSTTSARNSAAVRSPRYTGCSELVEPSCSRVCSGYGAPPSDRFGYATLSLAAAASQTGSRLDFCWCRRIVNATAWSRTFRSGEISGSRVCAV